MAYIFGIIMKNMLAEKWLEFFDKFWTSKRAKNTSKIPFLPLFLPHRKQSWEISILEEKMDTKFKNSTCPRKHTNIHFQQAILEQIL